MLSALLFVHQRLRIAKYDLRNMHSIRTHLLVPLNLILSKVHWEIGQRILNVGVSHWLSNERLLNAVNCKEIHNNMIAIDDQLLCAVSSLSVAVEERRNEGSEGVCQSDGNDCETLRLLWSPKFGLYNRIEFADLIINSVVVTHQPMASKWLLNRPRSIEFSAESSKKAAKKRPTFAHIADKLLRLK
jgi:hypothetical protein